MRPALASLDGRTAPVFKRMIEELDASTEPRWGRLSPARLCAHLRRCLEISLGEITVEDRSIPIIRECLRKIFFEWLTTWPGGIIRSPAVFHPDASDEHFERERKELFLALDRFIATLASSPRRDSVHPLFGPLTLETWSCVHGVHFSHHCRQFELESTRPV